MRCSITRGVVDVGGRAEVARQVGDRHAGDLATKSAGMAADCTRGVPRPARCRARRGAVTDSAWSCARPRRSFASWPRACAATTRAWASARPRSRLAGGVPAGRSRSTPRARSSPGSAPRPRAPCRRTARSPRAPRACSTTCTPSCGFRGNEQQYDDPRNSFLPEVLARRTGIPITLSIVAIEVAARAGLAALRRLVPGPLPRAQRGRAARRARRLPRARARRRGLHRAAAPRARPRRALEPGHLEPAATRDVLRAHARQPEARLRQPAGVGAGGGLLRPHPAARAGGRRRAARPRAPLRAARVLRPALDDLERFLALAPRAPEADALRARVEALRPQAARIH